MSGAVKLGKEFTVTLLEVGIGAAQEVPFGDAVSALADKVRAVFCARQANDELARAAIERFDRLMEIVEIVQSSSCRNSLAFQNFYDHLVGFQRVSEKWRLKGWFKKYWDARKYKELFDELFAGVDGSTRDLMLVIVGGAQAEAKAAFVKVELQTAEAVIKVEELGRKAEQMYAQQIAEVKKNEAALKQHITQAIQNQGTVIADGQQRNAQAVRDALERLGASMELSMQEVLREVHDRHSDFFGHNVGEEQFQAAFGGVLQQLDLNMDQVRNVHEEVLSIKRHVAELKQLTEQLLQPADQPAPQQIKQNEGPLAYLRSKLPALPDSEVTEDTEAPAVGQGGQGAVTAGAFRGEHVVLKHYSAATSDQLTQKRALTEALLIYRITQLPAGSRRVVRCLGIIEEQHRRSVTISLVLERAPQGSMDAWLRPEHKAYVEARQDQWVLKLADALRFLHEDLGITHCDVKPANVLLFDDGRTPKLADFGSCRLLAGLRWHGSVSVATISHVGYTPREKALHHWQLTYRGSDEQRSRAIVLPHSA